MIGVIDNANVILLTSTEHKALELSPGKPEPVVDYLVAEFPTLFAATVTHTLDQYFVALLPQDPRIEHVYWVWQDDNVLRVWIVIPEPDFSLESPIYDAQLEFMDKFPKYACDFYVIYRFGKTLESVRPQNAKLVK